MGAVDTLVATGNGIDADTIDLSWGNSGCDAIYLYYRASASWVLWKTLAGAATSQAGFSTLDNTAYDFYVEGTDGLRSTKAYVYDVGNFGDTKSETVTGAATGDDDIGYADTKTETLTLTPSGGEVIDASDTATETISVSDDASGAAVSPLQTTFRYYFGDFGGKMYVELEDLYHDDDTAIDCQWQSKDLDFGDMFPEMNDRNKTIRKIRLYYVDKTSGATATVGVSADGGTTWTDRSKSVGTGDGTTKETEFFYMVTGNVFRFRVRNNSTTDQFQWTRLLPYWTDCGDDF